MKTETGMAHTPGPWKVIEPFDVYDEWRVAIDDNDPGVAVVAVMDSQSENEANAHLIASAPELYAALKALLDWSTSEYQSNARIDAQARAALAKAEGSIP